MSADKELKAFIDRILRLKEEQDAIGGDIRDIYGEAKGSGYDKTAMGKLVAHLRKILKAGPAAADEQAMIFDTYLEAYERASGTRLATHTHEEDFDPITGEFVDDAGTPSVGSLQAAPKPLATRGPEESVAANSPETANETPKQVYGDSVDLATAEPSQSVDIPAGGDKPLTIDGSDEQRPAASHSPEQAPEETAPHGDADNASAESVNPMTGGLFANVGGDHVTAHQATIPEARETVSQARAHKPLRPLCLRPEACGGYGDKTCHSCLVAARTTGEAA